MMPWGFEETAAFESGVGGHENTKQKVNIYGATSATALQNAAAENKSDCLNIM
jgi:hypothetical protein